MTAGGVAAVIACAFAYARAFDPKRYADALPTILKLAADALPPDFSRSGEWGRPLLETLSMSIAATALAVALPLARLLHGISLRRAGSAALDRRPYLVATGLAGNVCPDHFFVSNIDDCLGWGRRSGLDMLIAESAGLCNRCSPHIKGALAVCAVDTLSGIHRPRKIGPMLKLADVVVITKGDIVSQAEREVFAFNVRLANPRPHIKYFSGLDSDILGSRRQQFPL